MGGRGDTNAKVRRSTKKDDGRTGTWQGGVRGGCSEHGVLTENGDAFAYLTLTGFPARPSRAAQRGDVH